MDECNNVHNKVDTVLFWFSGVALFIMISSGILFIPGIVKHIKGLKRLIILLQQLALSAQLLHLTLHHALSIESVSSYFAPVFSDEDDASLTELQFEHASFDHRSAAQAATTFISEYLHTQYYFFSLVQTLDVYVMICKPFDYKEFSGKKNLCVLMLKGCLACLLYASLKIVAIASPFIWSIKETHYHRLFLKRMNVKWWISVVHVAKLVIGKLVYTVVIWVMAKSINKALKESAEMKNQSNQTIHKRLFRFALIPLFLNFCFLPYEAVTAYIPFYSHGKTDCAGKSLVPILLGAQIAEVASILVASMLSYAAYMVLFSNLRQSFFCKNRQNRD